VTTDDRRLCDADLLACLDAQAPQGDAFDAAGTPLADTVLVLAEPGTPMAASMKRAGQPLAASLRVGWITRAQFFAMFRRTAFGESVTRDRIDGELTIVRICADGAVTWWRARIAAAPTSDGGSDGPRAA
jgi:hypothetical protein